MNDKVQSMLDEYLKNVDADNEEELEKKMNEFVEKFNNGEIEYNNTPLDEAYELLDESRSARTITEARRLAKKAYKICPECLDAAIAIAQLEPDTVKAMKNLDKGIAIEKERLEKEGYFDKENIGSFYGLYETRPYIRALFYKAEMFLMQGKITLAKETYKEILRLCESDNLGARFRLMAIYAYLEDEKELQDLYKKYPHDNFETLFAFFALYYKLENNKKAKEYLKKLCEANPHFIEWCTDEFFADRDKLTGMFRPGDYSEINMYIIDYSFLIYTMPEIKEYVLKNYKK